MRKLPTLFFFPDVLILSRSSPAFVDLKLIAKELSDAGHFPEPLLEGKVFILGLLSVLSLWRMSLLFFQQSI